MASKAEEEAFYYFFGTQLREQAKKDSAKPSDGASKAPAASEPAPMKAAPKPQETKKRARGGKSASKQ